MKENDDNKYIRIGIFAVVFLLGLFVSIIEKNGWIVLIACVGVPLLYIPYGISDWKRKKQDNPPEKVKALSIKVGMQNSGLATSLAGTAFSGLAMATVPSAVFFVWHNISGAVLAGFYRRWKNSGRGK